MPKIAAWLKNQLAWVKQKFAWLSRVKPNGDDPDYHQSPEATNLSEQSTASDFTTVPSKEENSSLSQIYFNQSTEIIDEYETVAFDSLIDQTPESDPPNLKLRRLRAYQGESLTDDLTVSATSTVAPVPVTLQGIPDVYDDLNQQISENQSKLDKIDQKIKEFYPEEEEEEEDLLTKTTNDHYFVHETVKIPLGDGKDLEQYFQTQKLESINTQQIDPTIKSDETDSATIIKKVG